jgi:hypothetical protein
VGYLIVTALLRQGGEGYNRRAYLTFGIPLTVILALFASRLAAMQGMLGGFTIPSARDPVHVLITVVAYFGVPLLGLGLLSPLLAPAGFSRRSLLFFLALGVIPILELLVIARLSIINVTWYYALIALFGFAVLAALSLVGLAERGRWRLMALAIGLSIVYYSTLLGGYYTWMHGDRPRWEEAAYYLKAESGIRTDRQDNPEVYATVPGVVQFYLLGLRENDPNRFAIRSLPPQPPAQPVGEQWYVIEAGQAPAEYVAWLEEHCERKSQFEARTGPRDRTITVYHHAATIRQVTSFSDP